MLLEGRAVMGNVQGPQEMCQTLLVANISKHRSEMLATNRTKGTSIATNFPQPLLWPETWAPALSVFVWIGHVHPEKEFEGRGLGMMANPAHPSPTLCTAAIWNPAALGHPCNLRTTEREKTLRMESWFALQWNYNHAVSKHKFGPCTGIFLPVQKLIFISKNKPYNSWNWIEQERENAADTTPGPGVSALYWALIFPTEFEKNGNSPHTSLPHSRAATKNQILSGRYLRKPRGGRGRRHIKEKEKGEREQRAQTS